MPNFSGLNVTVMTILALLAAVFAVFYLIYSAGLYGMAKKRGIRHAWLAFLPIGRNYITGKLVPMLKLGLLEVADMQIVYPLLAVLSLLCLAVRLNILAAIFFPCCFYYACAWCTACLHSIFPSGRRSAFSFRWCFSGCRLRFLFFTAGRRCRKIPRRRKARKPSTCSPTFPARPSNRLFSPGGGTAVFPP